MEDAATIGRIGEQAATDYLRKQEFQICNRNWRCGRFEIDIVAVKGDAIHFIEVKTRKALGMTSPESAVTSNKVSATKRAAMAYLAENPSELEPRFDLVAVDRRQDGSMEIRYLPDAIEYHW